MNLQVVLVGSQTVKLRRTADRSSDVGALIIRIGFWGPLYYNCNKEPPPQKKNSIGNQSFRPLFLTFKPAQLPGFGFRMLGPNARSMEASEVTGHDDTVDGQDPA